MTETPELSIYEKTFAKSDKIDAILVVGGKKLHVNKALLSYHSDYFNTLFNPYSEEKSIKEIPIKGVKFEDFATVLSLVHGAPINYTYSHVGILLKIADRFRLLAAKRHVELFILTQDIKNSKERALYLAEAFKLDDLLSHVLDSYDYDSIFELSKKKEFLDELSIETFDKLFELMLEFGEKMSRTNAPNMKSYIEIYEAAFAKSDKTDAILVVDGMKLHVNKAVLSHHSDYFNTLFNSEYKEKSMEEIGIRDVHFESFVTLLSFYHSNPIIPNKINAENILELADRFLLPSTKFYMEPYMIHFHFPSIDAIRIGEKYQMDSLYQSGFTRVDVAAFNNLLIQDFYEEFSADTKRKLFNSYLKFCQEPDYYSERNYAYLPNRMTETETPELSISEEAIVKTDKTDAILVVQGKKLHVNKALLSYHSDYFKTLLKSEFKENFEVEISIEDVKFEDFAIVLSLIHGAPIQYTYHRVKSLLKIADRFQLLAAKRHVELFILTQNINEKEARELHVLKWADKFKLNDLTSHVVSRFSCNSTFGLSRNKDFLDELSNETTAKLFERMLVNDRISSRRTVPNMRSPVDIYESTFAKSDKTDAILVVGEKKLHVNKAILSYHSDYFNTLFNSDFKEKSMEEIEIRDVHFESFVTLLSFYHSNPIIPTKINAENILELADRFLIPSMKFYMEPYLIQFGFSPIDAIRIGEKYRIDSLYQGGFNRLDTTVFNSLFNQSSYPKLPSDTKRKIFDRYVELREKNQPYYDY